MIVFVVPAVPAYRRDVYSRILSTLAPDVLLLSGERGIDATVTTVEALPGMRISETVVVPGRLAWQRRVLRPALEADVAVLTLNPRFVSTWLVLVLRRLLRRPAILWGHAHPRAGSTSRTDRVRAIMRRLATVVVVYTQGERAVLAAELGADRVVVAPNALLGREAMVPVSGGSRSDFVTVGRLVAEKRPQLLLRAFQRVRDHLPDECRLVFVGDGPLRAELEREVGQDPRIVFTGPVDGEAALRRIYADSLAAVIPGTAGLSLIQALGFGIPAVVSDAGLHGPEIAAAEPGLNSVFFRADDERELGARLIEIVRQREPWIARATEISEACRDAFNTDEMASALTETARRLRRTGPR